MREVEMIDFLLTSELKEEGARRHLDDRIGEDFEDLEAVGGEEEALPNEFDVEIGDNKDDDDEDDDDSDGEGEDRANAFPLSFQSGKQGRKSESRVRLHLTGNSEGK